jgi:hypothetical protein
MNIKFKVLWCALQFSCVGWHNIPVEIAMPAAAIFMVED